MLKLLLLDVFERNSQILFRVIWLNDFKLHEYSIEMFKSILDANDMLAYRCSLNSRLHSNIVRLLDSADNLKNELLTIRNLSSLLSLQKKYEVNGAIIEEVGTSSTLFADTTQVALSVKGVGFVIGISDNGEVLINNDKLPLLLGSFAQFITLDLLCKCNENNIAVILSIGSSAIPLLYNTSKNTLSYMRRELVHSNYVPETVANVIGGYSISVINNSKAVNIAKFLLLGNNEG